MNYRFLAHRFLTVYKQNCCLFRQKPKIISRTITTNIEPQLTAKTRQWAIKRYILLLGLPLTTVFIYRLSTKYEARRRHTIVLGSIWRAIR